MDRPHRPAAADRCDAVTLEIVKGALAAAKGEMEALLERTAMSPVIREKKDFFAAVFDADGRLVIGTPLPVFGHLLPPIFAQYPAETMQPGDLYWYNDCYGSQGGVSHSPDQVFVAPVFADDRLVGFAQSWAHFGDIGGAWPGSMSPTATDIFQEGIIIPPVRLVRAGVWNDELFRVFLRNSRFPDKTRGDTRALTAAVRLGERRLAELCQRFGAAQLTDAFDQLIEQTRAAVRRRLRATIKPGTYRFADRIDSDGQGHGPFTLRMTLHVTEDRVTLDCSETDDQAPGPVNFLVNPMLPRMVLGMYFLTGEPGLLLNEGAAAAVDEVILRPGSLLQPNFPAPLNQRGMTLSRLIFTCMGLVGVATRGQAMASSPAYCILSLRGRDNGDGQPFHFSDGVAVGYGGRPFADGIDAVYFVAQENSPAEFLDQIHPARLRRYGLNPDSGGPGLHRGGCGVVRELEWLGPDALLATRLDGTANPPWGLAGGRAGRPGRVLLNPGRPDERVLPPLGDNTAVRRGDVVRIETPGGGGWGDPFERPPETVRQDVLAGFVSAAAALADYGVALTLDLAIDAAATAQARSAPRQTALFHRGRYLPELA